MTASSSSTSSSLPSPIKKITKRIFIRPSTIFNYFLFKDLSEFKQKSKLPCTPVVRKIHTEFNYKLYTTECDTLMITTNNDLMDGLSVFIVRLMMAKRSYRSYIYVGFLSLIDLIKFFKVCSYYYTTSTFIFDNLNPILDDKTINEYYQTIYQRFNDDNCKITHVILRTTNYNQLESLSIFVDPSSNTINTVNNTVIRQKHQLEFWVSYHITRDLFQSFPDKTFTCLINSIDVFVELKLIIVSSDHFVEGKKYQKQESLKILSDEHFNHLFNEMKIWGIISK